MRRQITAIAVGLLTCAVLGCKKKPLVYELPVWNAGDWVEYEITEPGAKSYTVRYAVTGTEVIHSETYYWLEMVDREQGGDIIYKMLVPYGFRGPAERMIMKVGTEQAIELPDGLNEDPDVSYRPYLFLQDEVKKGTVGEEKIQVPAGTFNSIHAKLADPGLDKTVRIEAWVQSKIPLLGMVKLEKKVYDFEKKDYVTVQEFKLKASGKDAVTAIIEEPKKIENPFLE